MKNIIPLAIIGSGPAGLSAAVYGARSALHTVLFEGKKFGGQLAETTYVENWPGVLKSLGCDIIEAVKMQAVSCGALCVNDSIVEVDFSLWPYRLRTDSGESVYALSVIIATGATPRFLNNSRSVPGEFEYIGRGVSTCAVCDAPFYKGKKVIVIGGGDSAVEEALYISSFAESITMLVRGSALRASPAMQARLKDLKNNTVLYNTRVDQIVGDGTAVTGVTLYNTVEGTTSHFPLDGVFLAIGHSPTTDLFKKWEMTDADGYLVVGPYSQQTRIPGVFAAGDVADKTYRQAGVAAGDGIKAALDAYAFLRTCGYSAAVAREVGCTYYTPTSEGM